MAWYRTGTITVTNGSTTITGSGTAWIANAGVGEALYAPDGRLYEIANISSDTTFTLGSPYLGTTASAQPYVLVPSQSYIRDLAAQAADLVNNYSTIYNTVGQGKFPDGTLANPGIRFSDDLDTGFYRSASNEVTFVAGGTAIFKYNLTGGLQLTSVNLDGGTIDGTTIGSTTPSTGAFTTLSSTSTTTLNGTTIPASKTLVDTDSSQTLTGKTLTNPVINGFTGDTGVINIGSGQVYKDASGNVGIGTSSPDAILTVSKASTSTTVGGSTAIAKIINSESSSLGETAGIEFFNRSVGGSAKLAGVYGVYTGFNATGYAGALVLATESPGATNVTERMRIDASGNVGIGTSAPNASALLDVQSTTKGVRMPNMTTTEKNAIASPAAGLMVFDTTLSKLCVYSGAAWETITSV